MAMYAAKGRGRGRVATFEASMHTLVRKQLQLSLDLERALERNQLAVHYQPTLSLETREIEGAEALARWYHADGSVVPPGVFVPLAEQTGQILRIGRWVLEQACDQA